MRMRERGAARPETGEGAEPEAPPQESVGESVGESAGEAAGGELGGAPGGEGRETAGEGPEHWLEAYGDRLYRYALARVHDPMLAEDLVQETLAAALQARSRFAGRSSVSTWLTGILKHKIVDHLRRAGREQALGDDLARVDDVAERSFDRHGHWNVDVRQWSEPDRALEQDGFWRALEACLEGLPRRMAQALVLRELEGLSSEAICEALGIGTTNNLWVILSRARMRLRACLEERWFAPGGRGGREG